MAEGVAEIRTGWKVRPKSGGAWLFVDRLEELDDMLEHEGDDDAGGFELQRVSMPATDWERMREFDGW